MKVFLERLERIIGPKQVTLTENLPNYRRNGSARAKSTVSVETFCMYTIIIRPETFSVTINQRHQISLDI